MAKKRKKKRKLKYEAKKFLTYFICFFLIFIYTVHGGIEAYKSMQYKKTYEYKVNMLGYSLDEAKVISSTLPDNILEDLVNDGIHDERVYDIITQKYFILDNYERYINYLDNYDEDEGEIETSKVIALVNTNADTEWYSNIISSDIDKGYLVMVNKFYELPSDYERTDLESFSLAYAYSGNKAAKVVVEQFAKMQEDIKKELDVQLMVNSSYRSYSDQKEIYTDFSTISLEYADSYAARAGHSEHQTGLAIDITSIQNPGIKAFTASEEYEWLKNNSYKYGFILRYPEGKEDITGYSTESWHFRYVGEEAAKQIYEEDITFDEYYAYYIEK